MTEFGPREPQPNFFITEPIAREHISIYLEAVHYLASRTGEEISMSEIENALDEFNEPLPPELAQLRIRRSQGEPFEVNRLAQAGIRRYEQSLSSEANERNAFFAARFRIRELYNRITHGVVDPEDSE